METPHDSINDTENNAQNHSQNPNDTSDTDQNDGPNNEHNNDEDPNCPVCREEVENGQPGINCNVCKIWFHRSCLHMPESRYEELEASDEPWYCMLCASIKANKIKWGEMEGEEAIRKCISETYAEVTKWRKNLFMLPRGKAGCDYIKEKTRQLYLFINDTKWSRVALAMVHILGPLMLQKPSKKSKARGNALYLQKGSFYGVRVRSLSC